MSTAFERFEQFATIRTPGGCLLWTGRIHRGYGLFSDKGRKMAHIWSYMHFTGKAIEGQIDHLCHDPATCIGLGDLCPHRRCVEPTHLADVSARENSLRSNNVGAVNAAKTHCLRGHEFTPENTRRYKGGRTCRACARQRTNARNNNTPTNVGRPYCTRGHEFTPDNTGEMIPITRSRTGLRICLTCDRERNPARDPGAPVALRYCQRGHPRTPENTEPDGGCRQCGQAWEKSRYAAKPYSPRTHCIHGHEYSPTNTLIRKDGGRVCRTCREQAKAQLKTHCEHGHEFTLENTYVRPDNGGRQCRACTRRRAAARIQARQAA